MIQVMKLAGKLIGDCEHFLKKLKKSIIYIISWFVDWFVFKRMLHSCLLIPTGTHLEALLRDSQIGGVVTPPTPVFFQSLVPESSLF